MNVNPITRLDYPDPDVIRVEDTYYMVSTTMHFMPGCEILQSFDLVHWGTCGRDSPRLAERTGTPRIDGKLRHPIYVRFGRTCRSNHAGRPPYQMCIRDRSYLAVACSLWDE